MIAAALLLGFALGFAHFGGLYWTACRLAEGRGTVLLPAISRLARFAALAAAFGALARVGAAECLAALAGLWVARGILIRRAGGFGNAD